MAARAMWKGVVRAGDLAVPVKLYAAVEDRDVHFHLLHEKDGERLHQEWVDAVTGDVLERGALRKGYEVERGVFVTLDTDDLAELEPEASRDVEVEHFVPTVALDHRWYDRPYFLGPDGDGEAYAALARVLEAEDHEGVVRWTMRKKRYLGALRGRDGHLVLVRLRPAEEVVMASELEAPGGRDLDKKELAMAKQLVAALAADFAPTDYRDEHRRRLRELIDAKAEGLPIKVRKLRPKKPSADLSAALAASLEAAKEGRPKGRGKRGAKERKSA